MTAQAGRPSSFTPLVSNTSTYRRSSVSLGWHGGRSSCPRPGISAKAYSFAYRSTSTTCRGGPPAPIYEGSEYVTVAVGNGADKLEPEALNGTNRLDLYVCANERHRHAVLVAHLDNLGKGASGAAVQNLRLMLDLNSGPN